MRLIFVNPHTQSVGKQVQDVLLRRPRRPKYPYFVEHVINNPHRPCGFLLSGATSSFSSLKMPGGVLQPLARALAYLELLIWLLVNRINPLQHPIYLNTTQLDPARDILFMYARGTLTRKSSDTPWENYQGLIYIHLTHYFLAVQQIASNIARLPHPVLVAESNLKHNRFHQYYFPAGHSLYVLPFVFQRRHQRINQSFASRSNKCFAVGTIFEAAYPDYRRVFGDAPFHPMRQLIHTHAKQIQAYIDSFITATDYQNLKVVSAADTFAERWAKRVLPGIILEKVISNHTKNYFSFDIVEKYNAYRMFISPEEIIGLPSINFVEGMACGSAYFGIDHPMYTELGMVPNQHYVTYQENNLEDLIDKIQYYQQHPEQLEKIAARGYGFVTTVLSPQHVADTFWRDLEQTYARFQAHQEGIICTFLHQESLVPQNSLQVPEQQDFQTVRS